MGKTKGFIKTKSLKGVWGGWSGSRVEGVGEGMGAKGCFINIKDMYNNDGGQGGARFVKRMK